MVKIKILLFSSMVLLHIGVIRCLQQQRIKEKRSPQVITQKKKTSVGQDMARGTGALISFVGACFFGLQAMKQYQLYSQLSIQKIAEPKNNKKSFFSFLYSPDSGKLDSDSMPGYQYLKEKLKQDTLNAYSKSFGYSCLAIGCACMGLRLAHKTMTQEQ